MTQDDLNALADIMGDAVRQQITAIREEFQQKFDALEKREAPVAATTVDTAAIVAEVLRQIPTPKDGKNADPVDVDAIVLRAAELVPRPENGRDGKDADEAAILLKLQAELNSWPRPQDGAPGPKGDRGDAGEAIRGPVGERGEQGPPGEQGKDVDPAEVEAIAEKLVHQRAAQWELDMERRAQEVFQRAIDKMPAPKDGTNGKDGRDGFSAEDVNVTHDGNGNVTFAFKRDELERSFVIRLPRFKDQGVYAAERQYIEGDGVTFGGNFWIAQRDNPETKPAEGSDWRLAVRKGRDGRDGTMKPAKPEGPVKL